MVSILEVTITVVLICVTSSWTFDQFEDTSEVTWAHAVNSWAKLDEALKSRILFLEADISMGYVRRPDNQSPILEPIMAHPPLTVSDISLQEWIEMVVERANASRGVKLDFKSTIAANASLEILNKWQDKINFPLWLNADILPGPVNAETIPVDAETFIQLSRKYFPNATLSIGWTTNIIAEEDAYRYTWNQVWTMAKTIRCLEIDGLQPITFPIRALFVKNSLPQLLWLLKNINRSSLTIWSSVFDTVDIDSLLELRRSVPLNVVYYDMPKKQLDRFNELKVNVTYNASLFPSNKWGVLRDTTEPFGCEDETTVSGNTVVYGGDRVIAVFNEKPLEPNLNVTGKLYPYALSDIDGEFDEEREGAMAIILAKDKTFWSEGHWKTWQNLTALAIGVHSPNHSESCCSVDFKINTVMPEGAVLSNVMLDPCYGPEPCLVYTDTSSNYNISGAKELFLGFVFMGERAMILDEISVNGVPDYFVRPSKSNAMSIISNIDWMPFVIKSLIVLIHFFKM